MTTAQSFDTIKAENFAGMMLDILNHGAIALMTSIGHRTGLFDAIAQLRPSTSQEIADAAGLNERYIRQWLGAMVTQAMYICLTLPKIEAITKLVSF